MCWSHQKVLGKVLTIFFFLIFFGEIMVECKQKITKGFVKLAVLIYKNKKKWEKKRCIACKQAFIISSVGQVFLCQGDI